LQQSLAISSIIAYLKRDPFIQDNYEISHLSINCFDLEANPTDVNFEKILPVDLSKYQYIAISAYIWNEFVTNRLIQYIRRNFFSGKLILGGYQISYADKNNLENLYPLVDYFVVSYGENPMLRILRNDLPPPHSNVIQERPDCTKLPSPYLTNEFAVPVGTPMIRLETKRNCPYRCTFCAHKDEIDNRPLEFSLERIFAEIEFIRDKLVKKVNVLDPIFNVGKQYFDILRHINYTKPQAIFSLHARFELISGELGDKFLELIAAGNYHLEFGLQTIDEKESELIERKNDILKIQKALEKLHSYNISYEVSLIYGLPTQTVDSFQRSIEFLQKRNCRIIKAFPLNLLRGTKLHAERELYQMKEESIGKFQIPIVTSSISFTKQDWLQMQALANQLEDSLRIT
ncbi:MAG: radical SAM protein, partial [Bacteroidia bacterium]|nr:radical SAM protein [Bacteroidia bacterium]